MKQLAAVFVVVCGLAFAGGLDFGVSVRNGPNGNFMGHLGLYLDAFPIDVRTNLLIGAPQGLVLSGEILYTFPSLIFIHPYVGAGLGMGLTVFTNPGELTFRFGDRIYALLTAGIQFPSRGYRPYVEVTQYFGSDTFTRFTVGFISEIY
ncbi:MAG TPA: hypothetical protein VFS50_16210 [Meiothermus sp.]|jgi:hypothetical protein|nr:hypothetical protein [Meiothermus sp.]